LEVEQIDFSANEEIYAGVEDYFNEGVECSSGTADLIFGSLFSGNYSLEQMRGINWSSYTANKKAF
jgi:hypothetical protein